MNTSRFTLEAGQLHNEITNSDAKILITDIDLNEINRRVICLYQSNRLIYIQLLHRQESVFDRGGIIQARIRDVNHELNACFVEIDKDTVCYLRMNHIPKEYFPLVQGKLLPVKKLSEAQKGKRAAVTSKIDWKCIPDGNRLKETSAYKSAFSVIYEGESELIFVIKHILYMQKKDPEICISEIVTNLTSVKIELESSEELKNACQLPIRLYEDSTFSLAKLYSLEKHIMDAISRKIWLPSGGNVIMDTTEALTVFDVNSGKYDKGNRTKKSDQCKDEFSIDMVTQINLEALKEISLQLKLRNISGMILIDLINVDDDTAKEFLLEQMNQFVQTDYCIVKVLDITSLGIMELTRQKINPSLSEQMYSYTE